MQINDSLVRESFCNKFNNTCSNIFEKFKSIQKYILLTAPIPIGRGCIYLSRKFNIIPVSLRSVREAVEPLVTHFSNRINQECAKNDLISFPLSPFPIEVININSIISSECPLENYLDQANRFMHPKMTLSKFRFQQMRPALNLNNIFFSPIIEEVCYRTILQGFLCNTLWRTIIKTYIPHRENLMDAKITKFARMVISASTFSLSHLSNKLGDNAQTYQLINTFAVGMVFALIKEIEPSFEGDMLAIYSHIFHNLVGIIILPQFNNCGILPTD